MQINFPHTNPIAFEKETGEYQPYMDAYRFEGDKCWEMPMLQTDKLTFQFSWNGNPSPNIRIKVETLEYTDGGIVASVVYNDVTSGVAVSYGNDDVWRVEQAFASPKYNGYFHICNTISTLMPNVGGRYRVRVSVDEDGGTTFTSYVSSFIKVVDNGDGTKLLKYSDSRQYNFGTFFSKMPEFFWMRLPAVFLHPSPKDESEIFQSYDMGMELVSSRPYETVELEIGGRHGIPDYILQNLNYILHCDTKLIDGVAYELTADSSLDPMRSDGYNLSWVKVTLARRDGSTSLSHSQGDNVYQVVIGDDVISVDVPQFTPWVMVCSVGEIFLSQKCGVGSAQIAVDSAKIASLTQASFSLMDEGMTKTYAATRSEFSPSGIGIGYGRVGDTLYVYVEDKNSKEI